jgi:SnoaL-like domain
MDASIHDLTTTYIQAVGEHRLESLREMLDPDAEFRLGDNTFRGPDAFIGAFVRLMPILERNDIRRIFVDGDEACVIYDFVTDTPAGPILSIEYLKFRDGRIASSLLVFERLHWPEVMKVLLEREAEAKG